MSPLPPTAERTTRAVVTSADGSNDLVTLDLDEPAPGEFILGLEGCGLCGTDLVKIDQRRTGRASGGPPLVLGHELVGRIERVGAQSGWHVGQRVVVAHHVPCGRCRLCREGAETSCAGYRENLLVPGGLSERVLVRERAARHSTFAFDDDHDVRDLVFLEPLACVLRSIDRGRVPPDGGALILGAGSMGLLHLLALRATSPEVACTLVDRDGARRKTAEHLGAGDAPKGVRASTVQDVAAAQSATPEGTNSEHGFDVVFDTIGDPEVLRVALESLRPGGRAVLFAHGPPSQPLVLDFHHVFRNELTVTASYSSGRRDQTRAYELLAGRKIRPGELVTHQFDLSAFDEALRCVQNREAIKVLLTRRNDP